jgi:hypothetical protein
MLDADVTADACTPVGAMQGSIYTTCANIKLEGGSSTGAPAPTADSSCSVRAPRGHSLAFATALVLALWRRRRSRIRSAPAVAGSPKD